MTELHQERDELPGKTVVGVIVGILVAIAIGVLAAAGLESCRTHQLGALSPKMPHQPPNAMPPKVNAIETRPFTEQALGLADRASALERLESYGWVDRERGVVHIPIGRAFGLYLERRKETR